MPESLFGIPLYTAVGLLFVILSLALRFIAVQRLKRATDEAQRSKIVAGWKVTWLVLLILGLAGMVASVFVK